MSVRTLLLATGLAAALAAPAQAVPSPARFIGTITATQKTTWQEPRHTTYVDCFHQGWVQERGTETWTVKGRPTKVLVSPVGTGQSISLHYGNWNPHADGPMGIRAKVTRDRAWSKSEGSDPGECGGIGTILPKPSDDCGSRTFDSHVRLNHEDGAIVPSVGMSMSLADDGYSDCTIELAEGLTDGLFAEVPSKIPAADLLDRRQGLHVILGQETYTGREDLEFDGERTTTTTVEWQLRLKRVG